MSRIGKKPVSVPDGVDVTVAGTTITVKGKNGELSLTYHPNMTVAFDADAKQVVAISIYTSNIVCRKNSSRHRPPLCAIPQS